MPCSDFVTQSCCFALFLEFLSKECPRVHIFIDRIELKDIPEEQIYMRRWLHERFEIKDKWVALCRTFYSAVLLHLYWQIHPQFLCYQQCKLWGFLKRGGVGTPEHTCITLWLNFLLRRLGFFRLKSSESMFQARLILVWILSIYCLVAESWTARKIRCLQ